MRWISKSETHPGLVRDNNEDTLFACDEHGIWLLADGMGGHNGGEVASRMACETVATQLGSGESLQAAIEYAHREILDHAESHREHRGMGTTLVAAQRYRRQLLLAWVGDSRIYLLRNGQLSQLSIDHSFVQDMVTRGVLSEEEAQHHPQKHLLRQALGQTNLRQLTVDLSVHVPRLGDVLLLCSDGVHDMLTAAEISQCLASAADIHQQARALCERVLSTEAKDNFSFILLSFESGPRRRLLDQLAALIQKTRRHNLSG